jgi:hypothetical protein
MAALDRGSIRCLWHFEWRGDEPPTDPDLVDWPDQTHKLVLCTRKYFLLFVVGALALFSSACVALAGVSVSAAAPTIVTVIAGKPSEYVFQMSRVSAKPGLIVFRVTNRGRLIHSFFIARHRTKPLRPGKSATLVVSLRKPGRYVYSDLCLADPNLQEHLSQVPHCAGGLFTVK